MVAHARKTVDGSVVMVTAVAESGEVAGSTVRFASMEEALAAFEVTLPQHEAAYQELAK